MFDPQTKERAGRKRRVLICDGFGSQETLEILQFCLENHVLLCRLPSYASHKLQPCDIGVFGPLRELEIAEDDIVAAGMEDHYSILQL